MSTKEPDRADARTARVEMEASKVLLATWKPEIESLRADCARLRAALEARHFNTGRS